MAAKRASQFTTTPVSFFRAITPPKLAPHNPPVSSSELQQFPQASPSSAARKTFFAPISPADSYRHPSLSASIRTMSTNSLFPTSVSDTPSPPPSTPVTILGCRGVSLDSTPDFSIPTLIKTGHGNEVFVGSPNEAIEYAMGSKAMFKSGSKSSDSILYLGILVSSASRTERFKANISRGIRLLGSSSDLNEKASSVGTVSGLDYKFLEETQAEFKIIVCGKTKDELMDNLYIQLTEKKNLPIFDAMRKKYKSFNTFCESKALKPE